MRQILKQPEDKLYGFNSRTGAYELRNFKPGELVDKKTIERFGISEKFLEVPEKQEKS